MSQGSTDLIKNPNVLNDALKHYAKRLASFDNDKEIRTILPEIVQKELDDIINDISIVEKILGLSDENKIKLELKPYQALVNYALLCYKNDLEKSLFHISKKFKRGIPEFQRVKSTIKEIDFSLRELSKLRRKAK